MLNPRTVTRDLGRAAREHLHFLRQWMRDPLGTAAIVPSSPALARAMVRQLPPGARYVVELGAGTGVFTRALLARGITPSELVVVERNPELAAALRERFPEVRVLAADARDLPQLLEDSPLPVGGVDAVLSGLGLLAMPRAVVQEIVAAAFAVLKPEGRYIQFTYGPRSPIPRTVARELGLHGRRVDFTLVNLPPAAIWVYQLRR